MIEINDKVYRNLQEQVYENTKDINDLKNMYGYRGPYESTSDIENPIDLGLYLIGSSAPYAIYQYHEVSDNYTNIGIFNQRGPQGPEGPQGPQGETGAKGDPVTITVNDEVYTSYMGNIDLPDYPHDGVWGSIEGTLSDQTDLQAALDSKQNKITDLDEIRAGAALGATAVQPEDLATIATTGSYDDLTDKPTIGDATLTIQRNGTTLGTFTSNDTDDVTVNINVPDASEFVTLAGDQTLTGDKKYTYTDSNNKTYDFSLVQDPNDYGYATHYPSIIGQYTDDNTTYNQMLLDQYGLNYETQYGKITFGNYQIEKHLPYAAGQGINPPDSWGLAVRTYVYEDESNINEYDIYFPPKKSGTVAVTSDIPDTTDISVVIKLSDYWDGTNNDPAGLLAAIMEHTLVQRASLHQGNIILVNDTVLGYSETSGAVLMNQFRPLHFDSLSATLTNGEGSYITVTNYQIKFDYYPPFSGDYTDLTNKPDLSVYAETADLGDCAYLDENELSIAYSQITNTPSIPTKTSDLTNDSGYITGVTWNDVSNKPTFATVATSGDYDDLLNKPTLFSGDYDDLTDKPDLSIYAESANLATVATTGDYNDLTNKPTIPTVPTNVSAFTNDAGYITSSDLPTNHVTTDTTQTITGAKTFTGNVTITGDKLLKLKPSSDFQGYFTGFTAYDTSNREYGNLQIGKRSVNFGSGSSDKVIVSLGNYSTYYTGTNKPLVGFRAQDQSDNSRNFVMPTTNFATNFTGADTFYMPMMVNGVKANSDGNISISIPDVSNYYTKTEVDNLIPTVPTNVSAFTNDAGYITSSAVPTTATSTSTSTVTPTTVTLTFTYSNDTTENVTLMTGASVATTTTTTLS